MTTAGAAKRLTGSRLPYGLLPAQVRAWVGAQLGSAVVEVLPRSGGMSPAAAATVVGADGARAFVKAVGPALNPDTPNHFRHEMHVLSALPPAPYRAALRATYDDGEWVALLLDDVDGSHPDWEDAADVSAVFAAVQAQSAELTPCPPGLPEASVPGRLDRHLVVLADPPSAGWAALPPWAADDFDQLLALVHETRNQLPDSTYCHFDIRHDNVLIRSSDGGVVLVDWGMSRRGPRWGDAFVFALEWVELDRFDRVLDEAELTAAEQRHATGLLTSLGLYLAVTSTSPPLPGLPAMPAFRSELAARCLIGIRRRLGA